MGNLVWSKYSCCPLTHARTSLHAQKLCTASLNGQRIDEELRAKLLVMKTRVFVSRRFYFAAALDVESHSSFRGAKASSRLAQAFEAPRSRVA